MLCQQCHERSATIHLTQIFGGKLTNRDLCDVCGKEFIDPSKISMCFPLEAFASGPTEQMVYELIAASDPRFAKAAYPFLTDGMKKAREKKFGSVGVVGHVSAAEILGALRELATGRFGKKAKATLNGWGIFQCEDFGEMVSNLVEARLVAKQEQDSKADFYGGYDFDVAFPAD